MQCSAVQHRTELCTVNCALHSVQRLYCFYSVLIESVSGPDRDFRHLLFPLYFPLYSPVLNAGEVCQRCRTKHIIKPATTMQCAEIVLLLTKAFNVFTISNCLRISLDELVKIGVNARSCAAPHCTALHCTAPPSSPSSKQGS